MNPRSLSLAAFAALTIAACSAPGKQENQPLVLPALAPRAAATPVFHDYLQFGYDLARTGYDPAEKTLSSANVVGFHKIWKRDLGATLDAQPVLARGVVVHGRTRALLYIGAESGTFYALDAATGATVWSRRYAPVRSPCQDLPGGVFGITGTAAIDRARGLVYVATPQGTIAALDLGTGASAPGWSVRILSTPKQDHVYSALTFNPANGMLYAETAAYCDRTPSHGRIVAIDTASGAVVSTLYPAGTRGGGGVWGMGGVAIDARTNKVYAVTANSYGPNERAGFGEHALRMSPKLAVQGANFPGVQGQDADFGATPMLFTPQGCAQRMVAKNKSGLLVVWNPATLERGPLQKLQMADGTIEGQFIGVTAYSPKTGLVYVGNPHGNGFYKTGVDALGINANCQPYIQWQQEIGQAARSNDNVAPSVANGVLYVAGGVSSKVWAFSAAHGNLLWNSGPAIGGPTFTPPVADGFLFVPSWDHALYAFGP